VPSCSEEILEGSQQRWLCSHAEPTPCFDGHYFRTPAPSNLWFQMIWWFMGPRNGAVRLRSSRIRMAATDCGKVLAKLDLARAAVTVTAHGIVEVDEAFLGGVNNKEIIGIALKTRSATAEFG